MITVTKLPDLDVSKRLNTLSMEIISDMKPEALDAVIVSLPITIEDVESRREAANRGIEALHMQNKIIDMLQGEELDPEVRNVLRSLLVGHEDNV